MNDPSSVAPTPAHVAPAAVYDFDMFMDAALLSDPHARVSQMLREAGPLFWTPRNGGHWVALGHDAVFESSRNFEQFSSSMFAREVAEQLQGRLPDGRHIPRSVPISVDPPEHAKYRAPLASVFGPKAVKSRSEAIRALAAALIERVRPNGHCDFIPEVAEPLPVQVFLKMMGLPLERLPEFRQMVHDFLGIAVRSGDMMQQARQSRRVADACLDAILARRDDPQDDLISLLWAAEIEGEPMTVERMEDFAVLLFIAGLDTVINGMGFAARHLATHPELQNTLRADPQLIPEAVEELLRRYTFTVPVRRVAADSEFCGRRMKRGEMLMLYLPGADLDPAVFPDPETVDLGRDGAPHIAFGVGPHRCLGSHLARLELQILYEELLARLPTFRLDPNKPARFHAGNILALDSLPLRWD